ncbi:MAG: radical SAM family heme chaperone HemW [Clostridiales bacterium]|nr:radical SAM family heme chaperone HemW [Clostridiales bacterium]
MDGLYIHIPFCLSKCPYCDFYSTIPKDDAISLYCAAAADEMTAGRRTGDFTKNSDLAFDTVYFGGGTPSIIGADNIGFLLNRARKSYSVSDNAEITVECNPSSVNEDFFKALSFFGVNRISLGLQSAVDGERKALGRKAGRTQVENAVNWARKAGIDNISLDIMLGIPNQTESSLNETIDFCLNTGTPHISAYMLTIEENTVFYKRRDKLNLPDEDSVCDMYLKVCDRLKARGLERYEISNFAISGFESKHNLKYWRCEEYLGLGASAHSFISGKRFFTSRDFRGFIAGEKAVFDSLGGSEEEFIMLRLRLKSGLTNDDYREKFGCDIPKSLFEKAKTFSAEYVTVSDNSVSLTDKGALISNYIIGSLI